MDNVDEILDGFLASAEHIVIGDDREVTVPKSLRKLGVYKDHNMNVITFDCPRYSSGRDMSLMSVYINGIRNDGELTCSPATNIVVDEVDDTIMHFDWTITQDITLVAGNFVFLVCVKKCDSEGNITNHWNSELCNSCSVSEGLDCQESVIEKYPDLIEHLLLRMDNVEKVAVTVDQAEILTQTATNAADTAVEAKNTAVQARDEAVNVASVLGSAFANPIQETVKGSIVKMDDVSPTVHDVKVKVKSKNLVMPFHTAHTTQNGEVTMSCEKDGQSITLNGTSNTVGGGRNSFRYYGGLITLEAGKTYTLSQMLKSGNVTGGYTVHITNTENLYSIAAVISNGTPSTYTLTAETDMTCHIGVNLEGNSVYENAEICFQVEEGDTATAYEPYVDIANATITGCGKNIMPIEPTLPTTTVKGITFTVNPDLSITCNGTATANATFNITNQYKLPLGRYMMRGCPSNGSESVRLQTNKIINETASTGSIDVGNGCPLVIDQDCILYTYLVVLSGQTVTDFTFKPMLLLETDTDKNYETPNYTIYIPDEDGVCDVESIAPNMTVYTNGPGACLEVTYNRDTQKVVTDILDRLAKLESKAA